MLGVGAKHIHTETGGTRGWGHGGGERVRHEHRDYDELTGKLFVAICPIECNVKASEPRDLLKMGEVAYLEYYCFAKYHELYGRLPEFNDKRKSPKLTAIDLTNKKKP
jgi:hypothetical protein